MSDQEIEQQIIDKGLTAHRITLEHIDSVIQKAEYHRLTSTLTVCVLTLKNGFTVTGESACVSPENYDEAIGNFIAHKNAKDKIWQLEGYRLQCELNGQVI